MYGCSQKTGKPTKVSIKFRL